VVTLADGSQAVGRAVLVATGAAYRRLDAPGVDDLLGAGVFYGVAVSEARAMTARRVFVSLSSVPATRPARPLCIWPSTLIRSPCWSVASP